MLQIITTEHFRENIADYGNHREMLRSLKSIRYCKAETYADSIEGIMRVPRKDSSREPLLSFGFYMSSSGLTLISDSSGLRTYIEKHKNYIGENAPSEKLLLLLFEKIIEDDVLYLSHIDMSMDEMEERLLSGDDEGFLHELTKFRRKLSELNAFYVQTEEIMGALLSEICSGLIAERASWQELSSRLGRLQSYVGLLHEYALQLTELYQSEQAAKQNKVMGILTVVTTIFLPLTLLTGWYGMNFSGMPEIHWKYGYLCAACAAAAIVIGEIIYFRKKKLL